MSLEKKEQGGSGQGCDGGSCGAACGGTAASNKDADEKRALPVNEIRHKIMVMSGKGGVGKSTVATNLAISLALQGRSVGLLDVDLHGPSIPKMLKLEEAEVHSVEGRIQPVELAGVKVMSIGLLLRDRDAPVIWRGPLKMSAIKQFLEEVEWGTLDYLIIDAPPGTGDEPLSVCQLAEPLAGAVVVTTPQDVATADVRRSIAFCRQLNLPVLGVIENMSGFVCPHCGKTTEIFKKGGGETMARDLDVPFLGCIPIDPAVGAACDDGLPFVYHYNKTATAEAFATVAEPLLALSAGTGDAVKPRNKENHMKIAIPVAQGALCLHFGHCEQFALLEVDREQRRILSREMVTPPPHEPGVLPKWLHEQGANVIIAGGMGQRAQALFADNGILVMVGAQGSDPDRVALDYLEGKLETGENVCDH